MSSSNDGNDAFAQEMTGVKPLKATKKIAIKRRTDSASAIQARRDAATGLPEKDSNHLSTNLVQLLDAYYPLAFKRPGVQHGVYRKFKQGKYPQEARLDLHGMTVDKARAEVFGFIKEALSYDLRMLIIIHGKGSHSHNDSALLKSYVNQWLAQMEEVQAYCSAQPQHGGQGAVYVLLAKSERKKQQNRERFNRGRTVISD